MRWPWRRKLNGAHADATKAQADRSLRQAKEASPRIHDLACQAERTGEQIDTFTREVERAFRGLA